MGATAAVTQGVTSFAGAYSQSQALKTQGEYQKQQYDTNARIADMQAKDAIQRGDRSAAEHKKKVGGLIGSQRAALAAQGIDVNSGSAVDVQADSAGQGAQDILTIKNNAWREAWGFKTQSTNFEFQGKFAQAAANHSARNTLLTGGLQAVGYGANAVDLYSKKK